MKKIIMDITLILKGPLLTQSSNPGALGLDKVIARHNNGEKTPYIPGTLISGKLRQALEELQDIVQKNTHSNEECWFQPELNQWLGKLSEDFLPNRKQLFFSDFDLMDASLCKQDELRDRITISEKTGAAEAQHFMTAENPFSSGEKYYFKGRLHFFAPADETDNIINHIKTGFNWFTQLGSMKSVGFGQVLDIEFSDLIESTIKPPSPDPRQVSEKIGLTIKPIYPFCLASKPKCDNLFESEVIISGSALIGSIASLWCYLTGQDIGQNLINDFSEWKELNNNFSKLRISHAFPSCIKNQRPVVAPLSLCKVGDDKLYDISLLSKPCLINHKPPDFSLDWKDNTDTLKEYPWPFLRMKDWGWASLNSELRVRTAIDRISYRSKKGELFAYEHILPDQQNWYAELDLSRIDEKQRGAVFKQLQSLLEFGFMGLGKTKTPVEIDFDLNNKITPVFNSVIQTKADHLWLITLQTDSLLGSPESLNETSGQAKLTAMYKDFWERDLGDGMLTLVRYFARQKLSGGRYRKAVFQGADSSYRPWLLTEAGSIFVLQATSGNQAEAQKKISKWFDHGLPLSKSTCSYYRISEVENEQWHDCPYIAQNGYGEIAVNISTSEKVTTLEDTSDSVILIDDLNESRED